MCQPVCRLALPQQHCLHLQRSQTCAAGLLQAGKKAQRESMVQRELGLPTALVYALQQVVLLTRHVDIRQH